MGQPMSKKKDKRPRGKKKKGFDWTSLILFFIVLIGAGLIAYPTVSDWWNSFHQSRAIATYANIVENTSEEEMEAMLEEAREYNARLINKSNRFMMEEDEIKEYESLLDLSGTGVMGYIQINEIGVNLPVYHGTDEAVLQIAIGHIEGTSLPVGGPGTHAVMSGHRGLPSAKLFTDLDKLVEGSIFTVTVLNQTATYEVDQIRIVLPSELSDLNIVSGEDYCTLVTCTPYGVNTHRMLVRGHRIENVAGDVVITPGAIRIPNYITVPAVAIPITFLFLIGMLIYYRGKKPDYSEEELLEKYRVQKQKSNKA